MKPKVVSLSDELAELRHALRAALILSESLSTEQLATDDDVRWAPRAISAVVSLVIVRLRDLGRVVSGSLDPGLLWADHNSTDPKGALGDDPDVRFVEWPGKTKK